MKKFGSVVFTAGLMVVGCSGQPARGGAGPAPVHVLSQAAGTLDISAPDLVSAGMTQILASVPAQAGATYHWTIANGTIPGAACNAAVFFTAGAEGLVTLTCTVTVDGVATTGSRPIPVEAPMPLTPAFYGSGFSADALANTVVGGPSGNVVSYRFQAHYTTPLDGFRVFFIWSATKTGYNAGLGGSVRVDLMADDGTVNHLPAGSPLATTSYGPVIPQADFYPKLAFPSPVALKGGALYHLVFTNVDPDPVANYVSLDTLYTNAQTAPMQPVVADADFAVLYRPGNGAWRLREGYTPVVELDYATGSWGNGYMEVWSTNPKTISGQASVRETFQVTGPSRTFSKVQVRLRRVEGSDPLTVRVEEADGSLVDQVTVPASGILQGVSTWVTAAFPLSHVLNAGVGYHLVLSSPATSAYAAYPMRKGLDKGFSNRTVFPDGYAQFTTAGAAGWSGWDMWGTPGLVDSDLQFAFVP